MLFVKLLLALALCLHLPVIAFAHPGGTDSSGGHIDHDTGDYHYHHGYPAHDHYDMNGDGIVDCPYRFDDKTGSSSNESSKSFDEQLEEELEKLRKEKANATEPSFDDVPSIETTKSLWDKIPEGLQAIIGLVCFYGIFSIPGLISMAYKKIFKKK
jgi:hypothetical protein